MTNHLLHEFPQDEQDEFAAVCKTCGRAIEEFEVRDEDRYPAGVNRQ
ncbi:TPA: hypothetical protein U2L33_004502 [Burkholderia cenocepacia]|nr:hypothetical protein [Burkholderia cenocepacia]